MIDTNFEGKNFFYIWCGLNITLNFSKHSFISDDKIITVVNLSVSGCEGNAYVFIVCFRWEEEEEFMRLVLLYDEAD